MGKPTKWLIIAASGLSVLCWLGYEAWKIHNDQMVLLALRNERVAIVYGRNGVLGAIGFYKHIREVVFVLPPTSRAAVSELIRAPHLEYFSSHQGIDFTPFHDEIAALQKRGVLIRPEVKW
jgi:hypothetical protein